MARKIAINLIKTYKTKTSLKAAMTILMLDCVLEPCKILDMFCAKIDFSDSNPYTHYHTPISLL